MLKKSLIMLQKCTYNSQYIAHYAQVEPTMRHEETQLHYHRVQPFQFYMHVFTFEIGYHAAD